MWRFTQNQQIGAFLHDYEASSFHAASKSNVFPEFYEK